MQAKYDQQLAEVIARHQDELVRRTEALEADFAARLYVAQQGGAMGESGAVGESLTLGLGSAPGSEGSSTWHPGLDMPAWEPEDTATPAEGGIALESPTAGANLSPLEETLPPATASEPEPDPLMDIASAAEGLEEGQLDVDPFTDLDGAWGSDDETPAGMAQPSLEMPTSDAQALQPDGSEEDWSADPLDLTAIELPGIERLSPTEAGLDLDPEADSANFDWQDEGNDADNPLPDGEGLPLEGYPLDNGDDGLDLEALDALMATTVDEGDTSAENDEFLDRLDDDLSNLS